MKKNTLNKVVFTMVASLAVATCIIPGTARAASNVTFSEKVDKLEAVNAFDKINGAYIVIGSEKALLINGTAAKLTADLKSKIGDREIIEVTTDAMPKNSTFDLGGCTYQAVLIKKDNAQKKIGLSESIKSTIAAKDTVVYVNQDNQTIITSVNLGNEENVTTLSDNSSVTGASYYNMMNFYVQALQVSQAVGDMKTPVVVSTSTGLSTDKTYLNDLLVILNKINKFDSSLNLKFDDAKTSLNVIAKQGKASLKFHIQTNGYWGYALAGDSIINKVLDKTFDNPGAQYGGNIQLGAAKAKFFNIDYGKGIHVLRDTDLENPVIVMDKKEALLVDLDNYGSDVFRNYIKKVIGNRKLSVYITHNHGDHYINLQYLKTADVKTIYVPANENLSQSMNGYSLGDVLEKFAGAGKVKFVNDGDILKVAGKQFEVIAMKGHTNGGTQLLDKTDRVLFSGDTLGAQTFKGGTSLRLSDINLWCSEVNNNIERLGVNTSNCKFDYIIGGHTAYKNSKDYILNLKKCLEAVKENGYSAATKEPTGNLVVVKDQTVLTKAQIDNLFVNAPTDADITHMCSINVNNDVTDLTSAKDVVLNCAFTFGSDNKTPLITLKVNGTVLVEDSDYLVKYTENAQTKLGTVTITGINKFSGEISKSYSISE